MKKVLLLSGILLFGGVSNMLMAEEIMLEPPTEPVEPALPIITAPKWEEFCEPGYENAAAAKTDALNFVSFVKSERDKKTYWADRRASFEKYLNHCKTITDDFNRGRCYTDLRNLEEGKNEVYHSKRNEFIYQNNMIIKDASK